MNNFRGKIAVVTGDGSGLGRRLAVQLSIVDHFGHADLLINNAGITLTPTGFDQISHQQIQQVIDVNRSSSRFAALFRNAIR